jgi:hypothetical protein
MRSNDSLKEGLKEKKKCNHERDAEIRKVIREKGKKGKGDNGRRHRQTQTGT